MSGAELCDYNHCRDLYGPYDSGFSGDGGPATLAELRDPITLVMDVAGNLYITDSSNCRVRKVSPSGTITTVAGSGPTADSTGTCGSYSGEGGPATSATLSPSSVAVNIVGNLYISDLYAIRKVALDGTISTFAGNGQQANSGDGGPARNAGFASVGKLVFDPAGDLFVADHDVIREITTNGVVSTVAGNGVHGYSGDGGPATSASLCCVGGIAVDAAGDLYICDGDLLRMVDANGIITTIAGNGGYGFGGDGGPAANALFANINDVSVDAAGNLFVTDLNNNRIRKISTDGIVTTVAGNDSDVYQGDGGLATNAGLQSPCCLTVVGNSIYVSDSDHNLVRLLTPGSGPSGPVPSISQGGIVPLFSTSSTIQAGEWISIYGRNLISGSTPVSWNGDYPLTLGGTTVTFTDRNGTQPAVLSYVSSGLINLLVPPALAPTGVGGSVNVTVTDGNGSSATATVTTGTVSPSFSLLSDAKHVAAIFFDLTAQARMEVGATISSALREQASDTRRFRPRPAIMSCFSGPDSDRQIQLTVSLLSLRLNRSRERKRPFLLRSRSVLPSSRLPSLA